VTGVVLDDVTGQPIPGAYVAIDWSGDSGGSNLARFEEEGTYVNAETDAQGRFDLNGVALREAHPFYTTRSGYVRHEQIVSLSPKNPTSEITVRLRPAGKLEVSVVDTDGKSIKERFQFRLAADDGRPFVPPRADWPTPRFRMGRSDERGRYAFGELDSGTFSVDAFRNTREGTDFVGRVKAIKVRAGETASAKVLRATNGSTLIVRSDAKASDDRMIVLARDTRLTKKVAPGLYHAEDLRLGQVVDGALLSLPLAKGETSFRVTNLPPGEYAVFMIFPGPKGEPAVAIGSSMVEVVAGQVTETQIKQPPVR
jgi:hypothetical protein